MTQKNSGAIVARNQLEAVLRDPVRQVEIMNAMPFDDKKTKDAAMQQLVDFARDQEGMLAQATDKSKFKCCLEVARLGLQLNSPLHHAAAVPFRVKGVVIATLIVEYRGLLALMRRYGGVVTAHTGVIYEGDQYEWTESNFQMTRTLTERGEIVGAYAKLELKDGSVQTEVMTLEELEHVRSKSRAKDDGPWVSDTPQMYRKTVLRRSANLIDWGPKGADLLSRVDKSEFRYDDTGTVEVKKPGTPKKGSRAVLETLIPAEVPEPEEVTETIPPEDPVSQKVSREEIDPETGEILPPREEAKTTVPKPEPAVLHLFEAQRLCKELGLPVWKTFGKARQSLVGSRMRDMGVTGVAQFWGRVRALLGGLTQDYYEGWSDKVSLDILLRVPQRGGTDHLNKIAEGTVEKKHEAPVASDALSELMGGA